MNATPTLFVDSDPVLLERSLGDQIVALEAQLVDMAETEGGSACRFRAEDDAATKRDKVRAWVLSGRAPAHVVRSWTQLDQFRWQLAGVAQSVIRFEIRRRKQPTSDPDLTSAGWMGLYEAACRFDADRGIRFTSYARWWVRTKINEELEQRRGDVRVPTTARRKVRHLLQAREAYGSLDEAADRLGMRTKSARKLLASAQADTLPLDAPDDEGHALSERLVGTEPAWDDAIDTRRALALVRERMEALGERERNIVTWRFGLGGGEPKTFREIGDELGVSGERARQLCRRACKRMA